MERKSQEEMLGELNRIYREREEQFRKWDQEHEEKKNQLEAMLEKLAQQRKEISIQQSEISARKEELSRREQELNSREEEFSQLYTELERARSEAISLKMEAENYRFERALQDAGSEVPDPGRYILWEEHQKIVSELQDTVDTLRRERISLLKNSLGISEESGVGTDQTDADRKLTADILLEYLKATGDSSAEKQDLNGEEVVSMKRDGTDYSFLFTLPPTFMVSASRLTEEKKQGLTREHPELQISEEGERTILTGYFTEDMPTEKLVNLVQELGKNFESEEKRYEEK